MPRRIALAAWLLVLLGPALAPLPSAAQVRFDTVSTQVVGPGMSYLRIVAPAVPWSIDVLELDLTEPYLEVKTVSARDLRAGGTETTGSIAARTDAPGHRVVGAINGDFFQGTGETNGIQIGDGEVVRPERPNYPAIGFDVDNRPFMSRPAASGAVFTAGGSVALTGFNAPRGTDALVLLNRFYGSTSGPNASGTDVLIRPLTAWVANDTMQVVVEAVETGGGGLTIPAGKGVLSATGTAARFMDAEVQVGDTLRVYQEVLPGLPMLEDMISGNPFLVRGGVPEPLDGSDFNRLRHPRTAVGFNADTTKLYFITVDGRQTASAGMSNFELRDFAVRLGLTDALNLDGGGSTTMIVRGDVVNAPSGGVQRPVGNALVAVSTAPQGPLAVLQMTPTYNTVFIGQTLQLHIAGTDAFYNPAEIDPSRLSFSVDSLLGTVSPDGLFTAGTEAGTGYIYADYDGLRDSVQVEVRTVGRLALYPEEATTDLNRDLQFTPRAFDTEGTERTVPGSWISWSVVDTTVGTVNQDGLFRGKADGTTQVVARFFTGVSDTSTVHVAVRTGVSVLDPLDETDGWSLSSTGPVDTSATTLSVVTDAAASGGRSFELQYTFTESSSEVSEISLNTDLAIAAIPDSVNFTLRSDGADHLVRLDFVDHAGQAFTVSVPRYANDSTAYAFMPGPLSRANRAFTSIVFPIRLQAIRVRLAYKGGRVAGKTYTGALYIDDLRVTYPSQTTASEEEPALPETFAFLGHYPSPATDLTTITFRAERTETLRFVVYDVLGRVRSPAFERRVTPGQHAFQLDVGDLPSGVYFLRAGTDGAAPLKILVLRH